MSATAAVELHGEDAAQLGRLYGRYKALVLSVGASLLTRGRAGEAAAEIEALRADCAEAAVRVRPGLGAHFEACREAAERLGDLLRDAEDRSGMPAQGMLSAARDSHRRLRSLVWEIFDCEYVPCAGHGVQRGRGEHEPATPDWKRSRR